MTRWLALLAFVPALLAAQMPEIRAEAQWTRDPVWYVGTGLTWRAGNYARISALGAYPVSPAGHGSFRGDFVGRVTLDPFRRRRVGFSFGGGLTVARRARLLAVAELEGARWGGVTPAVQLGLGNGYRAAIVIRRAAEGRR